MNRIWLSILALVPAFLRLHAQDATPPPAPIITAPSAHMKWTMKTETEGTTGMTDAQQKLLAPQMTGKVEEWQFTKGGALTQILVTYGSGVRREYWRMRGMTLIDNPTLGGINFQGDGGSPPYPNACDGFWGIQNVKPSDDQGKKDFEGIIYHYFRGGVPHGTGAPGQASLPASVTRFTPTGPTIVLDPHWEAWFDLKTGLPKAFRQHGETLVFQFSPEIPGDLQLPPRFQAAWSSAGGCPIK